METAAGALTEAVVIGRVDRLPIVQWHTIARALLGFVLFFDSWDSIAIGFIAPSLIGEWHLAPTQIGFVISVGYVGQFAGAYLFGALAERYGRIPAFQMATLVMSVLAFASAFAPNYGALVVLRAVQGLGIGGALPVGLTYINEIARTKNRGRFVVLFQYITVVGFAAAALSAVWIVPNLGWGVMLGVGVLPLLATPLIQFFVPESPRWLARQGRLKEADRILAPIEKRAFANRPAPPLTLPAITVETKQAAAWTEIFQGRYGRRTIAMWSLWFLLGFVIFGLLTWIPSIYVTVYHLPVAQALKNSVYPNLIILLKPLVIAYVIDWMGRRRFGMWMTAAGALTLFAMMSLTAPSMILLIILVTCGQNFIGAANLMLWAYTPEQYPTRTRALAVGAASACSRGASMLAPIIIGAIIAATGSAAAVFGLLAVCSLAAFLILWLLCEETAGRALEEISP